MALTERLAILITGDGAQAISEFKKVGAAAEADLGKAEASAAKLSNSLIVAGAGAVAFGGVLAVGLKKAVDEFDESEIAAAKMQNTLANAPQLAGQSATQFDNLAKSLQKTTVVTDEQALGVEALLGQYGATAQQIETLTPLVVDFSRKMGVDLETASKSVGKALEGNLATLQRNGILVDKAAFSTDHYGATLEALKKSVGGFAQAEGQTFSGQLTILEHQFREIAESVGKGAVDAFESLLGPVTKVAEVLNSVNPAILESVGRLAAYGSVALIAGGALAVLQGSLLKMQAAFGLKAAAETADAAALTTNTTATAAAVTQLELFTAAEGHAAIAAGAATDAIAAETGQLTLFTVAATNAAAGEAEIAATGAAAGAATGAGFAAALGPIGLVAAAIYATGSIIHGFWNNSTDDIGKLKNTVDGQLVPTFDSLAAKMATYGQNAQDVFKAIAKDGADGLAQAQRVRDAFAATGKDTTGFDGILQSVRAAQPAVKGLGDDSSTTADAVSKMSAAMENAVNPATLFALGVKQADEALKAVKGSTFDVADAATALGDAYDAIDTAAESASSSASNLRSKQQAVESATRGVTTAQRQLEKSSDDLAKAQQGLTDAEQALADARKGATARQTLDASLGVSDAQRVLQQAQLRAQESVQKILQAQASGDPLKVKQALLDREDALAAVTHAQLALEDAQQKAADTAKIGQEGTKAVTDAEKKLEAAHQAVDDATQRVIDSQQNLTDAYQKVRDAEDNLVEKSGKVVDVQKAVTKAVDATGKSVFDLIQKLKDQGASEATITAVIEANKTKLQEYGDKYGFVRGKVDDLVGSLTDLELVLSPERLGKAFASLAAGLLTAPPDIISQLNQYLAGQGVSVAGSALPHRAMGGSATGPVVVGDGGVPEVFDPRNSYVYPSLSSYLSRSGGSSRPVSQPVSIIVELDNRVIGQAVVDAAAAAGGLPIRIRTGT